MATQIQMQPQGKIPLRKTAQITSHTAANPLCMSSVGPGYSPVSGLLFLQRGGGEITFIQFNLSYTRRTLLTKTGETNV